MMKKVFLGIVVTISLITSGCASKQFVLDQLSATKKQISKNTDIKIKEEIQKIEIKLEKLDLLVEELSLTAGEIKGEMVKGLELEKELLEKKLSQIEATIRKFNGDDIKERDPNDDPEKEMPTINSEDPAEKNALPGKIEEIIKDQSKERAD